MALFEIGGKSRWIRNIPLELIDQNPMQPRKVFNGEALEQLAASIKENGLISPIVVRKVGNRYQLIAGERRLMAFLLLDEPTIPAIIEQADDDRSAVLAMVENIQRCDLSFFEEAQAIKTLIKTQSLTQQQAADKLSMSQSAVANKLRLLKLPEKIRQKIGESNLTERHARALLPLCLDERLEKVVTNVIERELTVSQTEKLVEETLNNKPTKKGKKIFVIRELRLFTSTISRAIDLMKQAGIDAVSQKTEDEESITYTVVIPKSSAYRPHELRSQALPLR
ncbi:MAG: ParB/RepB/Spo0J family partition protein, partial [Oscillospiraceae bacterium]|nr:ParB/RepB/Spo0J family partition protein [Oscillospiraceae bacterium]